MSRAAINREPTVVSPSTWRLKALGLSRTTLWREVARGRLPRPIHVSLRRIAFPLDEVRAALAKRSGRDAE